jgi:hypothetical protein
MTHESQPRLTAPDRARRGSQNDVRNRATAPPPLGGARSRCSRRPARNTPREQTAPDRRGAVAP